MSYTQLGRTVPDLGDTEIVEGCLKDSIRLVRVPRRVKESEDAKDINNVRENVGMAGEV